MPPESFSMQKNNIRKILLGSILLLMTFAAYSLIKSLNKGSLPIETLKTMSKNVDIEIENFKVTHEGMGDNSWEIKAKDAKVRNKENKVLLTDVNVTLNAKENQKSTISADTGTLNRETKEIQLEGNVKFKADVNSLFGQFDKQSKEPKEEPANK